MTASLTDTSHNFLDIVRSPLVNSFLLIHFFLSTFSLQDNKDEEMEGWESDDDQRKQEQNNI